MPEIRHQETAHIFCCSLMPRDPAVTVLSITQDVAKTAVIWEALKDDSPEGASLA
jgi:hypothetical protein